MAKRQAARQKVSFISTRKINVSRNVSFKTAQGKRVSFRARKTVSKPVRVAFYARTGRTRKNKNRCFLFYLTNRIPFRFRVLFLGQFQYSALSNPAKYHGLQQ